MSKTVYSHCRSCTSSCGLVFETQDNRIISMTSNRESLVSGGYKCIKGDMSVEMLNNSEFRFENSQKRQANGELQPIDNEQLMDEVADVIQDTLTKYGPGSVGLYWGTSGYRKALSLPIAKQFMMAIQSPKQFSTMTIDQSAHWVVDGRMGVFATGKPFFDNIDLLLMCGSNPIISNANPYISTPLVNQARRFRELKAKGGQIIVVDPRKTDSAKLAHLHIQPKPGTDTELFAGLIHLLLQQNLQDQAFCDRFVTNIEPLRESVATFTSEFVSERTGVPIEQLRQAVELIGKAKRPSIGFGTGTSMSPNGNTAAHMVEALNALCGGFNRAGDAIRNPGIFFKKRVTEKVIPPKRSWERGPKLRSGFGMLCGEFPTSRLMEDILTDGEDQIKVLFVMGANPMLSFGEPEKFKQAAKKLDKLIVIEPRSTETTDLADYVVAPPLQYEVADFNLAVTPIVHEKAVLQYTDAVVTPPAGTIDEWRFFNGIANRLGHTLQCTKAGYASSNHSDGIPLTTDQAWTNETLIQALIEQEGFSMETVRNHPHGLEVTSDDLFFKSPNNDDGARLDLCPNDVAAELANIYKTEPTSKHAYKLICRRITEMMNTEFQHNERIAQRFGRYAPLYIHPADMEREDFSADQVLTITGEHGTITGIATPDETLRTGVVAMTHGYRGSATPRGQHNHTSVLVSMEQEHVSNFDAMPQQSAIPVSLANAE